MDWSPLKGQVCQKKKKVTKSRAEKQARETERQVTYADIVEKTVREAHWSAQLIN